MFSDFQAYALGAAHEFFGWPPISADLPSDEREFLLLWRAAELDWHPDDGDDSLLTWLRISGQFAGPQEHENGTRTTIN